MTDPYWNKFGMDLREEQVRRERSGGGLRCTRCGKIFDRMDRPESKREPEVCGGCIGSRAGFTGPVMDVEHITLTYTAIEELLRDLKVIGAHNVTAGRRRGLTGKGALARLSAAYERFRTDDRLPATYEVVYGHAWVPEAGARAQDGSTVVQFPANELRTALRRRS